MGNNLSTAVAIIFMYHIKTTIMEAFPNAIKFWVRYIDDIFLLFESVPPSDLLSACNDVHPHISFTIEESQNGKLPYLDLLMSVENGRFVTTLYAKPMHSGNVIPWDSHHPRSFLLNILRNELRRAIRNASGPMEERQEIKLLRGRYVRYGYPPSLFARMVRQIRASHNIPSASSETSKPIYLSLPFISARQVREVKNTIRRCGLNDKLRVCFKSCVLSSILRPLRGRQCFYENCIYCASSFNNDCFCKFCVYFVSCNTCDASYVGETSRTIRSRLREHVTSPTSHVFQHLRSHSAIPKITEIRWNIIHRGLRSTKLRQMIEAQEIRSRRPSLNAMNCPS